MDKGSSFIRRKRKEEKFTRLPNEMLRNDNLSWKARGLLSYMLSMPDDWVFYETELVKHSKKDGLTALRTAIKELKQYGYVTKEPIRDELGKIVKWVTYVDDDPIQNTENLECGKPTMWENHNVENQTLLTTDSLITTNLLEITNNTKDNVPAKADTIPYKYIVDYLNLKSGKNFKSTSKETKTLIKSRFNDGFTEHDFIKVIDNKVKGWLNDEQMDKYIRPKTLFGTKFESYLNENVINKKEKTDVFDLISGNGDEYNERETNRGIIESNSGYLSEPVSKKSRTSEYIEATILDFIEE